MRRLLLALFLFVVVDGAPYTSFQTATLRDAAEKCCPTDVECCLERLRGGPAVACPNGLDFQSVAVCLEAKLWKNSTLQLGVEACCELLETSDCKATCHFALQAVAEDFHHRLGFLDKCPVKPYEHNDSDCLAVDRFHLHKCFGHCIAVHVHHGTFEPIRDCLSHIPWADQTPCMTDVVLE